MSTAGEVSGARKRPANGYERDPLGWYVEEPWTVEALWWSEQGWRGMPGPVWDPACGAGNIPQTLARLGLETVGTDIVERGPMLCTHDFLGERWHEQFPMFCGDYCKSIVTNPPYGRIAEKFILRALGLVGYVAALVQAKFPYSQGRYERLYREHAPSRILFLVDRPSMPPGAKAHLVEAKGGKMDFCWMIWDRRSTGPTTAHWIRRPGR